MIAITTNTVDFEKQLALEFGVLELRMTSKYRDFTQQVFKSIVLTSPQWSGNLASNWNYSANSPDTRYKETAEKDESKIYKVGADPAVSQAISRAEAVAVPSWRIPVYITNTTPADEGGYLATEIEEGRVKLRPVNMIPAQGSIISYAVSRFKGAVL
jgi:hypothetical protein